MKLTTQFSNGLLAAITVFCIGAGHPGAQGTGANDLVTEPLIVSASYTLAPYGLEPGGKKIWQRAKPTADGGLVLIYRDSSAWLAADGANLGSDTTAGLDMFPAFNTAYDDAYRLDSLRGQLYFRGADGVERPIRKMSFPDLQLRGSYLGATPLGVAILREDFYPYRQGASAVTYLFVDSLGYLITSISASNSKYSTAERLESGFFLNTYYSRYDGSKTYATATVGVLPWWTLARPSGIAAGREFCGAPLRLPISWQRPVSYPDSVAYTFDEYSKQEAYTVQLGALRYNFPIIRSAEVEDYVDSLLVTPVCQEGAIGAVELRGLDTAAVSSYSIANEPVLRKEFGPRTTVVVRIVDTSGCTALRKVEIPNQRLSVEVSPACADGTQLGTLTVPWQANAPKVHYSFDQHGIDSLSPALPAGEYALTISTPEGCSLRTVVIVDELATSELAIDTVTIAGTDGYIVTLAIKEYKGGSVSYGLVGLSEGVRFQVEGNADYAAFVQSTQGQTRCVDTIPFSLGSGLVGITELDAPGLRIYTDGSGALVLERLPASAKTCRVFDALGRLILQQDILTDRIRVMRPEVLPQGLVLVALYDLEDRVTARPIIW